LVVESPEELLACVGGKGTLFPLARGLVHARGIHHLVVRVLAFNREGEYVVQRRAETKESCPGYLTDSASGHVTFRLGLLFDLAAGLAHEASRELLEEVGLVVVGSESPLIRPFSRPRFSRDACETSHCFVAAVGGKVKPSGEVDPAETGFLPSRRLKEMLGTETFVPVARDYWLELLEEVGEEDPFSHFFGN
jgi:isopentenyldiphosphate isomerase